VNTITSTKNPLIQTAKGLQTKAARDASGLFLCEGEHMVAEALRAAPASVTALFVDDTQANRYGALLQAAPAAAAQYAVPPYVLAALSQVKTPQGIAAMVRKPPLAALDALGLRIVLLENVQDPGNVGTILRTADAAGFSGCILTEGCADAFAPKTLRATMGSVFRVPMFIAADTAGAIRALAASGYAVVASALDGEDFYARQNLPASVCLLVGNEGAGLSAEVKALATHRYRLPMRGGAESLNAAIAAAVFMYEIINRG
jgi:RNA methyltransferase, TrmH family